MYAVLKMAYFPAPGTTKPVRRTRIAGASKHRNQMKKLLKSASFVSDTLERLIFNCFRFYSKNSWSDHTVFFCQSAIVICCRNCPFNIPNLMYKSTLCWALTRISRWEKYGLWYYIKAWVLSPQLILPEHVPFLKGLGHQLGKRITNNCQRPLTH